MADIKQIVVDNTTYDIKDAVARAQIAAIRNCSDSTFVSALIDLLYPVGSVYISYNNSAPFTRGTWSKIGTGRALVGVDTDNTLMNTPGKTFGTANAILPSHTHTVSDHAAKDTDELGAHTHGPGTLKGIQHMRADDDTTAGVVGPQGYHYSAFDEWSTAGSVVIDSGATASAGKHKHTISKYTHSVGSAGEAATNKNYQPSIAVYVWKRIA